MTERLLSVEVAYALPDRQALIALKVVEGATVRDAIERSGMLERFKDISLDSNDVGIWSRSCKLADKVREGDRVEIYRALTADPKDIRRRRAEKAKEEGRADQTTGGRPNPLRAKD
ncbi:RnfH family protein [Gallaecimonas kandeliae]|uniref:RnfH family protein n=1 Tax=Gallaecimonas kandeliae TaxID=3029055 RepID=UPI0026486CEB|nr:RnfH family protein [Gallaecimonas kandeliae]WKE66556.1 RnfH family protein [Gallaecimonas kandeliae]